MRNPFPYPPQFGISRYSLTESLLEVNISARCTGNMNSGRESSSPSPPRRRGGGAIEGSNPLKSGVIMGKSEGPLAHPAKVLKKSVTLSIDWPP